MGAPDVFQDQPLSVVWNSCPKLDGRIVGEVRYRVGRHTAQAFAVCTQSSQVRTSQRQSATPLAAFCCNGRSGQYEHGVHCWRRSSRISKIVDLGSQLTPPISRFISQIGASPLTNIRPSGYSRTSTRLGIELSVGARCAYRSVRK
jgi:hypothetical protein